jgi:hypothetical protein
MLLIYANPGHAGCETALRQTEFHHVILKELGQPIEALGNDLELHIYTTGPAPETVDHFILHAKTTEHADTKQAMVLVACNRAKETCKLFAQSVIPYDDAELMTNMTFCATEAVRYIKLLDRMAPDSVGCTKITFGGKDYEFLFFVFDAAEQILLYELVERDELVHVKGHPIIEQYDRSPEQLSRVEQLQQQWYQLGRNQGRKDRA